MKAITSTSLLLGVLLFAACADPSETVPAASISTNSASASSTTAAADTKPAAGAKAYAITAENSKVEFTGSKVTGKHDGGFKTFTGHFTVEDGVPVGNDHKVEIDMNSTFADDEKLTGHLKSPDFFDVAKYPQTTFDVTELKKDSDTAYTVSGNFKLHGVEKNISFPATVTRDGDTVNIKAEFDINRKDFGIVYAGKADDLIRDEVVIRLDLTAKPEA